MIVGERIRARRKAVGVSADKLAEAIGVSRSTIFRYENGAIEKLPLDILVPIAAALFTTPEYLMGWTNDLNDYDDPDLIGSIRPELLKYFNGDVKKAYAAQNAEEEDAKNEKPATISDAGLSQRELEIVTLLRQMSPEQQAALYALLGGPKS